MPHELWTAGKPVRSGNHLSDFIFPNGSIISFRSLDDWNKLRSFNVGFIAYDECNEIDAESYDGMIARVRQKDLTAEAVAMGYTHEITRRGIWGATNPAGKDWLYRRFHPESQHREPGTAMFTSTTLDNPFLPPDYVEKLLNYPKPWVQRYVLCQFDDFAGMIYDKWGWDTHTVPAFDWKQWNSDDLLHRTFWMGMDPGTKNPTAGLWVMQDPANKRLIGVAEYEVAGVAANMHTQAWRRIEAQHQMKVRWRVSDPNAITQRDRGTALSLQTQYAQLGYNFELGPSREPDRIMALGTLIQNNQFVVTRDCVKTFEAIKQYQWKDISPAQRASGEDVKESPLKKNTHLVECAQFLAARRVPSLKKKEIERRNSDFQSQVHSNIRKELAKKIKDKTRGRQMHDLGGLV